ncbi:uncharacterized protein LOC126949959 [Macaca thibetana thibetana]|uniref:uncharacterized protein LOC126949959 n=1 Tax=Macaca thibetana thibetana TaxID=257877 RepID=UPI0021BCC669|nr:uncharacterized protein LOC126949959 [Macaca thibetana thibetana]
MAAALQITWKLHIPYHPQSSGKVESANGLLKHVTKLNLKTCLSWVTLLPLALTRLRAAPRAPTGLSPFELLYGHPFLFQELPALSPPLGSYLPYLTLLRELLRKQTDRCLPASASPTLENPAIVAPGDLVLVKQLQPQALSPRWEGSYTVILTTPTAAKLLGLSSWYHLSQLKKPPTQHDSNWTTQVVTPTKLRLTCTGNDPLPNLPWPSSPPRSR